MRSLLAINSADPFPAQAIPFTRAVDAPDPIPNVKHLYRFHTNTSASQYISCISAEMICALKYPELWPTEYH